MDQFEIAATGNNMLICLDTLIYLLRSSKWGTIWKRKVSQEYYIFSTRKNGVLQRFL